MKPLHIDPDFFRLLEDSYSRLLQRSLVPRGLDAAAGARWLYEEAPFGILAHDTAADPIFVYGNRTAQELFGYSWGELTVLPSRLSAEAPHRGERADFLRRVSQDGFVEGYRGMRITKSGKRFWIEGVTVWQLTDDQGVHRGQAARLPIPGGPAIARRLRLPRPDP
jgi:PAS domain S-box-containing protein